MGISYTKIKIELGILLNWVNNRFDAIACIEVRGRTASEKVTISKFEMIVVKLAWGHLYRLWGAWEGIVIFIYI